jgi:hypothetical protein
MPAAEERVTGNSFSVRLDAMNLSNHRRVKLI